jgi:2-polyprenyl-6-methoxyphenol hydroxylase-like FAD-dependent oxidoreductase
VFDALGCGERLAGAGFVVKRGAQLLSPCGEHRVRFDFAEQGISPSTTIQVHRSEFDALLLAHAESLGARSEHGRAREYAIDGGGVTLTYAGADGTERSVRTAALIDASGRAGFVARREGVRRPDDELKKAAVYAHFRRVRRDPGEQEGEHVLVLAHDYGHFKPCR